MSHPTSMETDPLNMTNSTMYTTTYFGPGLDDPEPIYTYTKKTIRQRITSILRRKMIPFVCALLFFCLIGYIMSMVQVYVQNLTNRLSLYNDRPIHDRGFVYLPHITDKSHIPDYYVISLFLVTLITIFINRNLLVVIDMCRRTLIIIGLIYIIRTISISITLLPNPYQQCQASPFEGYFYDALMVFLFQKTTCHDCFFSGHTVVISSVSLLWYDYLDCSLLFRLPAIVFAAVGASLIVMCHFHYSVDVMFGLLISYFIWKYYHSGTHRVERWLVRRQQHRWSRNKVVRQPYTKLAKQFISREIGQVENDKDRRVKKAEPLEHRKRVDNLNVYLTAAYIRVVIWFESWDDFLKEKHELQMELEGLNNSDKV
ncbi:sphingomyelin synthase [Acrasis kona]|uniref:Sphingomyelin synthase n=1 Tax=Acrasis kona TaxID=1008807 RepID=A0AAW2YKL7_9EUKA